MSVKVTANYVMPPILAAWLGKDAPKLSWPRIIDACLEALSPFDQYPNRHSLGVLVDKSSFDILDERLNTFLHRSDLQRHWFYTVDGQLKLAKAGIDIDDCCDIHPASYRSPEEGGALWGVASKLWMRTSFKTNGRGVITDIQPIAFLTTEQVILEYVKRAGHSWRDLSGNRFLTIVVQEILAPWYEQRTKLAQDAAARYAIMEGFRAYLAKELS